MRARPERRSCPMVDRRYVFIRFNFEKLRSPLATAVTCSVRSILNAMAASGVKKSFLAMNVNTSAGEVLASTKFLNANNSSHNWRLSTSLSSPSVSAAHKSSQFFCNHLWKTFSVSQCRMKIEKFLDDDQVVQIVL